MHSGLFIVLVGGCSVLADEFPGGPPQLRHPPHVRKLTHLVSSESFPSRFSSKPGPGPGQVCTCQICTGLGKMSTDYALCTLISGGAAPRKPAIYSQRRWPGRGKQRQSALSISMGRYAGPTCFFAYPAMLSTFNTIMQDIGRSGYFHRGRLRTANTSPDSEDGQARWRAIPARCDIAIFS